MATVDFGGVRQQVKLDLVTDVEIDRYVLVHSGYAIEVLTAEEAKESLEAWMNFKGPGRGRIILLFFYLIFILNSIFLMNINLNSIIFFMNINFLFSFSIPHMFIY